MIPEHTEQAIKDAANIVDVVGRFVTLKRAGVSLKGLCPFHGEKTPSFSVTPANGLYYCFGCGKGGDAITFIMEHKKLTFLEALKYLAGFYNIPIDATGSSQKNWTPPPPPQAPPPPAPITFYPKALFRRTLQSYEKNHFAQFLINKFGPEIAAELIGRYFVGTSAKWPGANVFWQIDINGKIRGGKVMLYDPVTGKRNREKLPDGKERITWAHSLQKLPGFKATQCFFGEHLLRKRPESPVSIVESEKTAILASAYLPQNIWLAACGKGLGDGKFEALKGRKVTLWPDAGNPDPDGKTPFLLWSDRAAKLRKAGFDVAVSDLIEKRATGDQRAKGYDLADYLLRYDLEDFAQPDNQPTTAPQAAGSTETPTAGNTIERFTSRLTGQSFERAINEDGHPAMFDESAPPTASPLHQSAAMLAAFGWEAGKAEQIHDVEAEQAEWDNSPGRMRAQAIIRRNTVYNTPTKRTKHTTQ